MSTGSTGSIFPKWRLAILLGAPLALGLTYLYYRRQNLYGDDTDDAASNAAKKKLGELKVGVHSHSIVAHFHANFYRFAGQNHIPGRR